MKIISLNRIAVCLMLVFLNLWPLATQAAGKSIGELCKKGTDCASGICIDLHKSYGGCHGKVCSQGCRRNSDCPPIAAEPDCEPYKGDRLCFYEGWKQIYCGKTESQPAFP